MEHEQDDNFWESIVFISDLHCGDRFGLYPKGYRLSDSGQNNGSKYQEWLWDTHWVPATKEFVPKHCKNKKYILIVVGDSVQGITFKKHLVTEDGLEQVDMAHTALVPLSNNAKKTYIIEGTGVHDGKYGEYAKELGVRLNAEFNKERSRSSFMFLRRRVNGVLLDARHWMANTSNIKGFETALEREYSDMLYANARYNVEIPDLAVRAHVHNKRYRVFDRYFPDNTIKQTHIMTLPGWQMRGPFVNSTWYRSFPPQFGLSVVNISKDSKIDVNFYCHTMRVESDTEPEQL